MTDVINPKRASPDQLLPYHKKISAEGKAQMICFISYTYMVLKDTVRVREDVTISPGKPNIRRILWREVRLQGAEARQEDGKILVKGELAVFFLYESDGTEIPVQWEEKMIPFRNETECEMSRGDLTGRTEVTLLRADMELQEIGRAHV